MTLLNSPLMNINSQQVQRGWSFCKLVQLNLPRWGLFDSGDTHPQNLVIEWRAKLSSSVCVCVCLRKGPSPTHLHVTPWTLLLGHPGEIIKECHNLGSPGWPNANHRAWVETEQPFNLRLSLCSRCLLLWLPTLVPHNTVSH